MNLADWHRNQRASDSAEFGRLERFIQGSSANFELELEPESQNRCLSINLIKLTVCGHELFEFKAPPASQRRRPSPWATLLFMISFKHIVPIR